MWQGWQAALSTAWLLSFAWADCDHSSTKGLCVPWWHSPHPVVRSTPTDSGASGSVSTVGLVTWFRPGPWQASHCTS